MDREDILLPAEKLVRQGRLNLAITEYKRVVDDYPEDWATANTLGDMYLRAQQVDKAVEQYSRIADHLAQEGFLPKAAALYKKTLKIKPAYEHALLQGADIALRQGLMAEAKQYFAQLVTHRRAQGNLAGVAEVLMRVAALDPNSRLQPWNSSVSRTSSRPQARLRSASACSRTRWPPFRTITT
jgi:tetratricopeptide (TPR) repeat protein